MVFRSKNYLPNLMDPPKFKTIQDKDPTIEQY
jgi:hypothetical protein